MHCYHVVQLVAKLEGRNCVLTQRKAHQKLDVSTEVPTVSYLKGRIADTSYILCDKALSGMKQPLAGKEKTSSVLFMHSFCSIVILAILSFGWITVQHKIKTGVCSLF